MRGIRIWHLAALALSVPLLAAAVPSGCTGGLNPNFRSALGQDPGSGVAIPTGYILLGIFNETGYVGNIDVSIVGAAWTDGWTFGFGTTEPRAVAWACEVTSIEITGGELLVPDPTTGQVQPQTIEHNGGPMTGNGIGQPLECGTFLKVRIVPVLQGGTVTYHAFVEVLK